MDSNNAPPGPDQDPNIDLADVFLEEKKKGQEQLELEYDNAGIQHQAKKIGKTRRSFSDNSTKHTPKILSYLKSMKPGERLPKRGLTIVPRTLSLKSEFPKDAKALKANYDEVKQIKMHGNRFLSVTLLLIQFIENYEDKDLVKVFKTLLSQNPNPDVPALLSHIRAGGVDTFHVSKVGHPTYDQLTRRSMVKFNILRLVCARKDLLDVLVTTFDSMIKHRTITTGWEVCEPGVPESVLEELQEEENQWDADYQLKKGTLDPKALNVSEEDMDAAYTENLITEPGIDRFYNDFVMRQNGTGTWSSKMLQYMDEAKFDNKRLKGAFDSTVALCHYFPCFRALCVGFRNALPSMLSHAAETSGCRLMRNSVHHSISIYKDSKHAATNLRKLAGIIAPDKATFTTSVSVSFKFLSPANTAEEQGDNDALALRPFKEEVLFELLDRKSHHYKYLKSTPVKMIPRNVSQPFIEEASFSPALHIEDDDEMTSMFLDDYMQNDCFLNVDSSLALYNWRKSDCYKVKFSWRSIEGPKDYVTGYLIASTLVKKVKYVYQEELKKLFSMAQHEKDTDAQLVLDNCFPEYHP